MKVSPQSTASVYSRRNREECKRDAAFDARASEDPSLQEESALTFCQFVAESPGKIKELYVRPGSKGEKLSRHTTLWARWSGKSASQAQAARMCLQENFKPLLNHPDAAVRNGTQLMLQALAGKLDDHALRDASQALGQAISDHRFDRVNGVLKHAPKAQSLGVNNVGTHTVDDEFPDETGSSEDSQAWSEHELPAANDENLKSGDAPLLEALDAFVAYEVKRLSSMDGADSTMSVTTTRLDIGRLDAEGTASLAMNAAEALHRYVQDLPDGSVLMASAGPNDGLFVHARLTGPGQPAPAESSELLETYFCGVLGQLAMGFAEDKPLGVEVEADRIADFAADHRDKRMPMVVTTELRQHLKQMSAWASTQANEDRLRREALAPIAIGTVVNGTSELNDGALPALRDYIDRVPEGSVLSLYQDAAGQLMLMAQPVSPGKTPPPLPHANDVENLRFTLEHMIEPFTAHDAPDVATHAKNVLAMVQRSRESDQALVANEQLKNALGYVDTYGPLVA